MIAISDLLDIDSQQVLHNLGYNTDSEPSARVESLVNEYVEHASQLIEPSYSYVVKDVEWVQGNISFVRDQIIFKSQVIARLLEHCQKVAIFVLTIGNRLEEMVGHLAEEGLVLQAAVLDAIGTEAVEKLADFVQGSIAEMASAQGLCISRRFSPGYCDWNIGQQRMVFRAMEDDHAGVRLTEKCLMLPQKSVSAVIGIGPCNNVENYNPCKTCKKRNCIGRR